MSFIKKIMGLSKEQVPNTVKNVIKTEPSFRFGGGFERLGAQVRPADTRTPEQLKATIDVLTEHNPAIKEFVAELKEMEPKHLALASDTIELANRQDMLMTNVDMNKVSQQTGKSLLQHLLSIFPKASKENPQAMDFAQEVINNTDTITSKYFLAEMNGIFGVPDVAEHLKAIQPMIKPFAEEALKGGYTGTFEKQERFVSFIRSLLTPKAKPEKIALIPKLDEAVDKVPEANADIFIDDFTRSDAPIEQVKKNIEILPEVLSNATKQGKRINVVEFVNNNVNLVK